MMSFVYLHDGSFEGIFTAIARALKDEEAPADIQPESGYQGSLFESPFRIAAEPTSVEQLFLSIQSILSRGSIHRILNASLFDGPDRDMILFLYIKEGFRLGRKLDLHHNLPAVDNLHKIAAKVGTEAHRFQGLLRFRELEDCSLYVPFNPDHRIIHLVAGHFRKRLAAEKWVIHDLTHRMAVYWDRNTLQEFELSEEFLSALSPKGDLPEQWLHPDEGMVQELWRTFFRSIAIASRVNPKLQRQWMPKRYWPCLVETNP